MHWASSATHEAWAEDQGADVVVPWERMSKVIRPKGGNCGVVIAAPGVGKTTFLLNWAAMSGMKTLFISSDTTVHDLTEQLGSLATNEMRRKVGERLSGNPEWRKKYAEAIYQRYPNIVVDFSPSPSTHDIREKVAALTDLWGMPPQMIVMDTASNVRMTDMGANAEWQRVWLECISIARDYNSFFVFAHHVKQGPARGGTIAPTAADGLWGADQFPEFVFGLHMPKMNVITCTVVKNRGGPKNVPIEFDVDLARAKFMEPMRT